jgi:hypothetical protein
MVRINSLLPSTYLPNPPETTTWLIECFLCIGLTTTDVQSLSPKFWALHLDPINPYDMAAFTLLTIHYNLAAGTLARFLPDRPDLEGVMADILDFNVS